MRIWLLVAWGLGWSGFLWLLVGLIAIQAFKMGCVDGDPESTSYESSLFDQIAASVGGLCEQTYVLQHLSPSPDRPELWVLLVLKGRGLT